MTEYETLSGVLLRRTPKAALITFDGDDERWVPLSNLEEDTRMEVIAFDSGEPLSEAMDFAIAAWFVKQEGLR